MRVLARRRDRTCLGHPSQDSRGTDGNSIHARQFARGMCMLASPFAKVVAEPGTLPLGPCIRVWSHVFLRPIRVTVVAWLANLSNDYFPSQLNLCIAAQSMNQSQLGILNCCLRKIPNKGLSAKGLVCSINLVRAPGSRACRRGWPR